MSEKNLSPKEPFHWGNFFRVGGVVLVALIVLAAVSLGIFRVAAVTFVDNFELGYSYDLRTGTVSKLDRTGYIVAMPFVVQIHTIDLRPMQVCINANKRVLNCKLVQFDPMGMDTFISWHGRNDYNGSSEVTGGLNDILKSYAYDGSGKTYPFLKVIRELKPDEVVPQQGVATK